MVSIFLQHREKFIVFVNRSIKIVNVMGEYLVNRNYFIAKQIKGADVERVSCVRVFVMKLLLDWGWMMRIILIPFSECLNFAFSVAYQVNIGCLLRVRLFAKWHVDWRIWWKINAAKRIFVTKSWMLPLMNRCLNRHLEVRDDRFKIVYLFIVWFMRCIL